MLLVAGPIIAVAAVLVKLDSKGPVFFIQERVGRNNRTYRCFKLRTMRVDSNSPSGRSAARIALSLLSKAIAKIFVTSSMLVTRRFSRASDRR